MSAAARAGRAAGEPGPRHRRHPPPEEVSPGAASGGGRGEARLVQLLPALEVTLANKTFCVVITATRAGACRGWWTDAVRRLPGWGPHDSKSHTYYSPGHALRLNCETNIPWKENKRQDGFPTIHIK